MRIIKDTPAENGAYAPLQDWPGLKAPDGYFSWPDSLSDETFQQYNGFVVLSVVRGIVQSYEPNTEAWEAWKASLPPEPEPEPTDTEVLNTLLGVADDE